MAFVLADSRRLMDARDVSEIPFELCSPVREFSTWQGKRHHSGALWMSKTGRHVVFESLAERTFLLELDRTVGVDAVSSQPMEIQWVGSSTSRHTPDYFVRMIDSPPVLVDVRPLKRIDDVARAQFDRTAEFCARLGWSYTVYALDSVVRDANLRFLSRYRDPRWDLDSPLSLPVGDVGTVDHVSKNLDWDGRGIERCYWLLWSGYLEFDLELPLTPATRLTRRSVE
ncbi:TnsA-like heteromeric transposase endonuclease subunit [Microbacterium sp. Root553]|uniref:TnsA-like heteromeric transposase endonuclease subunit n=1 Tax=Microbacterium sp. Root553 TaxID=1736556 RepID=UPI00138F5BB9|nr:TnsA-like heteromeric transposase endonuclease subunit [Microbacterium sp. Root553]